VIYAIRAVGTQYVKVGKATSVGKRLKELEVGCPHDLHIEAVADWPDEEERRLHRYLDQSYVRGEWYRDSARLEDVIGLMRNPDGLGAWKTICEAHGWFVPIVVAKPKRQPKPKAAPKAPVKTEVDKIWEEAARRVPPIDPTPFILNMVEATNKVLVNERFDAIKQRALERQAAKRSEEALSEPSG
jgi:hypothetical protein